VIYAKAERDERVAARPGLDPRFPWPMLGFTDNGCRPPTYGLTSDRRHLSRGSRERSCRPPSQTASMPRRSTARGGQTGDPDGTGPLGQRDHDGYLAALRSPRKTGNEHRQQCFAAPYAP
jgi:hypothetical protein